MLLRIGTWVLLAVAIVYLLLVGIELFGQASAWPTLHRDRDFPSYYLAARRLLRGQDTYTGLQEDARELGIADYFIDAAVNPPTFTLATLFLALFPYVVSWGLWQVLSLAALVLALALMVREQWSFGVEPQPAPSLRSGQERTALAGGWPAVLRLGCAALLFPPLTFHLLYAHTELLMLLLLTVSWVLLRRDRQVASGILLGLAAAVRIYPLVLLLYLLLRRSWKAFFAAVVSGLTWAGLTALVAGPSSFLRYLAVLRGEVPSLYPLWGNFSLWGSVHKLASIWPALAGQPAVRDGLALAFSLGTLGLTLWLARRPGRAPADLGREYSLFIVAALLASPLSWVYYQVLLYLPFGCLLAALRERRRPAVAALLGVALAASLTPVLSGLVALPTALSHVAAFLPTLTLAGTYLALALLPRGNPGS
jgi:hypothetical protein